MHPIYWGGQDVTGLAVLAGGIIAGVLCLVLFEGAKWRGGR